MPADADGEGFIRIDGNYLADALKACGGMVDFKMSGPISPMLFSTNGYQLVVMPMFTEKAKEYEKAKQADVVAEAEAVAEQAEPKPKGKRKAQKAKVKPVAEAEPEAEPVSEEVEPVAVA